MGNGSRTQYMWCATRNTECTSDENGNSKIIAKGNAVPKRGGV
jgi:hypothetical protein